MIVAFLTTVTLLPALLSALKPAGEPAPVGWAALAPLDRFLDRRRNWVVGVTLAAVILGLPLLGEPALRLQPARPALETGRIGLDPARSDARSRHQPEHDRCPRARSRAAPPPWPKSSSELPEVAKVRTLESFVPKDQDEKLALIDDASFFFENTLTPDAGRPGPDPGRDARGDQQDRRRSFRRGRRASTARPRRRRAAWRAR